jgi:hypothetical protein
MADWVSTYFAAIVAIKNPIAVQMAAAAKLMAKVDSVKAAAGFPPKALSSQPQIM